MAYYMEPNLQVVAGGNIRPSRIVKISTAADNTVLEGTSATTRNIGVAQQGTRNPPGLASDDGFAAIAGENIGVYGPGSGMVPVQLGGTVAAGDALTADSNGLAIATTTEGDQIIGFSFQAGVANDIVSLVMCVGLYAS